MIEILRNLLQAKGRHARESGHPGSFWGFVQKTWIPVFTGMTEGTLSYSNLFDLKR